MEKLKELKDMSELIVFLQACGLLAIGGIARLLWIMKEKIGEINGSVGKLNTWKDEHDKKDERFYDQTQRNIRDLWDKKIDKS